MPSYPRYLLPRSNYRLLEQTVLLSQRGLVLIRHTCGGENVLIEGSKRLQPDEITIQSDHLHDLSCNLLGVFQKEDVFYKVVDKKFHELWNESTDGLCPNDDECFYDESRKCYFISIDELLGNDMTHKVNGSEYHFMIFHTATRCNFWHISIRVLNNEDIEVSELRLSKKQKHRIWVASKEIIINQLVKLNCDNYRVISQEYYIKNDTPYYYIQ